MHRGERFFCHSQMRTNQARLLLPQATVKPKISHDFVTNGVCRRVRSVPIGKRWRTVIQSTISGEDQCSV
jgi:hypothetical protein